MRARLKSKRKKASFRGQAAALKCATCLAGRSLKRGLPQRKDLGEGNNDRFRMSSASEDERGRERKRKKRRV